MAAPVQNKNLLDGTLSVLKDKGSNIHNEVHQATDEMGKEMSGFKHTFGDAIEASKDMLEEVTKNASSKFKEGTGYVADLSRKTGKAISANVRSNTWYYMAGVALLGLIFGFITGRRKSRK